MTPSYSLGRNLVRASVVSYRWLSASNTGKSSARVIRPPLHWVVPLPSMLAGRCRPSAGVGVPGGRRRRTEVPASGQRAGIGEGDHTATEAGAGEPGAVHAGRGEERA